MKRRLYFLFPDAGNTRITVNELQAHGIGWSDMHAIARPGTSLEGLPEANERQRHDGAYRLETLLWDSNLVIFFLAFLSLPVLLYQQQPWYWLLLPAVIMLGTFLAGVRFTGRVPNVHLAEFRDAIHHGEILLMVDAAPRRVREIESLVHHHPEAVIGGVGWHINAFRA